MSRANGVSGFTIIELAITVAVLAVLAGLAAPSFTDLIASNRTTTQANTLVSALQLTRSEAVKRGTPVTLSAQGSDFNNDWCMHAGSSCTDANQIRRFEPVKGVSITSPLAAVAFSSRGERTSQSADNRLFILESTGCNGGEGGQRRVVAVSLSGHASVTRENC